MAGAVGVPQFTKCESCGYFTLTFLGVCTNAQCLQPKGD